MTSVTMETEDIIAETQARLGLESRAELEHALTCSDCYWFDRDDGGSPHWCQAFRIQFRGYVAREPTPEETARTRAVAALWEPVLRQALTRGWRTGEKG